MVALYYFNDVSAASIFPKDFKELRPTRGGGAM